MPGWLGELVKEAAPLGGGVAIVLTVAALVAWTLRGRYEARAKAVEKALGRARTGDIPGVSVRVAAS